MERIRASRRTSNCPRDAIEPPSVQARSFAPCAPPRRTRGDPPMLPLIHTLARKHLAALATATLLAALPMTTQAQPPSIVVASTTSTEQSGLFGHILPQFKQASGIDVKVVALGTGQALDVGRRGDADVVFVHDAAAEQKFVDEGHGIEHRK